MLTGTPLDLMPFGPLFGALGKDKGKARKPYELGVKTNLTITHRQGLMVGARTCPGNPYDGPHSRCRNSVKSALGGLFVGAILLTACGPSKQQKAQIFQETRVACIDKLHEDKSVPPHDTLKEVAINLDGQWFIGPRAYGIYDGSLAFFWPSRTPARKEGAGKEAPEFIPSSATGLSNFYEVGIEIFLRCHDGILHGPGRYEALRIAEAEGRVISKSTPRRGLDVWRVRDKDGLRPFLWYIATAHKGFDGHPPILSCEDHDPKFDRCTTAFIWRPGIAVDMRFRAKHGMDWPEIYSETVRVLQLLKKA